ncbi:MAG: ABC transporter permease [Acidobacteriota bacterium]
MLADFRSAVKSLIAIPGVALLAIGTLSVGLALCVAVATVINAYAVRALPYPTPDRLYRVDYAPAGQAAPAGLDHIDWTQPSASVVEVPIAWDLDVFYLLGGEYPEPAPGAWVTPGYVTAFGIRAIVGRTFVDSDYSAGAPAVALISHRLWQTRYGGDPSVVGRSVHAFVSDRPEEPETFTVVGVLPAGLWHLNVYTELLAPLRASFYPYMIQVRPGVSRQAAEDWITVRVRAGVPSLPPDWRPIVTSVQESYVTAIRPVLLSVAAVASLVLLIASANVAVLLLIRGRRRQRELAVRLTLGASRARLGRLLAFEAAILGGSATALGIVLALAMVRILAPLIEPILQRRVPGGTAALAIDGTVLSVAVALGLVITGICTLIPLATSRHARLQNELASGGRATTEGAASRRAQSILIGLEVAASLTLLAGAALTADSARRMLEVDFGFRADEVMTASVGLRDRSYPDQASRAAFYARVGSDIAGVAASRAVAMGDWWPMQPGRPRRLEAQTPGATVAETGVMGVTGSYFETLGIVLKDGRTFSADERLESEPVVIVSETLARQLWDDGPAVGQLVLVHPEDGAEPRAHAVVGVVSDVRQTHADTRLADAYVPLWQRAGRFAYLFLRAPQGPQWERELRARVAHIDREVALGASRSLGASLGQERATPQFLAGLLSLFAALACVLAVVGVYGVIAYAVRQRQREIAVRIAVGATSIAVLTLFLRQGTWVLAGGLLAGWGGALGLGRVLHSQLFGVPPDDPRILALSTVALAGCAVAAMIWPAWRATTTDPALVLKEE